MNLQNLMKQAQKMQGDLAKKQDELNQKIFPGKYSLVEVELLGNKKIHKIKISQAIDLSDEDREILEDAIMVAINNLNEEIDTQFSKELGSIGKIPGLF